LLGLTSPFGDYLSPEMNVYHVKGRMLQVRTFSRARGSVSTRYKGYIGGYVLGIHVKDIVGLSVDRVMGCTDCSDMALGWFRKTTLYSTYQELVYSVGEPWQCPDGLQVVKPPNMNFHKAVRPKNTDRIKLQDKEPIHVRCSRNLLNQAGDLDNQGQNPTFIIILVDAHSSMRHPTVTIIRGHKSMRKPTKHD
nr:hypothetical protein [Tanacetum cinerariifolium]